MPLVRISCYESRYTGKGKRAISEAVYLAMRETIGVPEGDKFIVFSEHNSDSSKFLNPELFVDPHFQGMHRSDHFVLIQITLSKGRTVEQKQALYARIAERLHEAAKIPPDDVMIVLTENSFEDWSFGKGQAQYVLNPPAWARKTEEGN
jgi:4-oxalocrotonate tautomerase